MDALARSDAVIQLGVRLIAELKAEDDLLSQWMAQEIAARISAIDPMKSDEAIGAGDECAHLILMVWEHRASLPRRDRIFGQLEPLLRTLVSLDVDGDQPYRYIHGSRKEAATRGANADTKGWLDLAFDIDYAARILVEQALIAAAEPFSGEAQAWVELSLKAGVDPIAERRVLEFVSQQSGGELGSDEMKRRERLEDRCDRLRQFAKLAGAFADELQKLVPGAPASKKSRKKPSTAGVAAKKTPGTKDPSASAKKNEKPSKPRAAAKKIPATKGAPAGAKARKKSSIPAAATKRKPNTKKKGANKHPMAKRMPAQAVTLKRTSAKKKSEKGSSSAPKARTSKLPAVKKKAKASMSAKKTAATSRRRPKPARVQTRK